MNECFRSLCRNILILNVLFMVCGAMARGGGGGWGEEWHLVWPQFWSSIWPPSGNGKTQMTSPIPTPKSKPRDFSEPPQTIDNEDSLITFANNNRNRQWTNKTPWSKYTWPVSNCKAREKAWKQVMQRLRLIVKRTTKLPEDFRRSLSYPEQNRPVETLLRKLKTTVEFRIRRGRWIEAKKTLSYRVSLRRRPVYNCVYCLKFKFRHLLAGICEYFTLCWD